jgi:hypothetical protein
MILYDDDGCENALLVIVIVIVIIVIVIEV